MDSSNSSSRQILATSLKALLRSGLGPANQSELKRKSGVAQSTIGRILQCETAATIETLEQIAGVYGLQAWQLLVPDMEPSNPPVLAVASPKERELYQRLKDAVVGIAALDRARYKPD